ncbi:helix-turn-helix domain-containing protein [Achromobacter insuavis]
MPGHGRTGYEPLAGGAGGAATQPGIAPPGQPDTVLGCSRRTVRRLRRIGRLAAQPPGRSHRRRTHGVNGWPGPAHLSPRLHARHRLHPRAFLEALRLETVRTGLEAGQSLKPLARAAGFRSETQLAKAFQRRFGLVLVAISHGLAINHSVMRMLAWSMMTW